MLRKKLFSPFGRSIRGTEIYRIEALSDAVFAFTVSLLIMSLEVPKTFDELEHIILQFMPFLATVSLVFFFWWLQNEFFRNYGLNDKRVIFLNLSLLILILFYVYPLKFLFSVLLGWVFGVNYFSEITEAGKTVITQEQFPKLIVFFSLGYSVIWFIFYLLYRHVYSQKNKLALTVPETFFVKANMTDAVVQMAIGVLAVLFAITGNYIWSGLVFMLIPCWLLLNNYLVKRKLKQLK